MSPGYLFNSRSKGQDHTVQNHTLNR